MLVPKPSYAAVAGLLIILLAIGYAAFYAEFRLSFFTVAAYHVYDFPESAQKWLSFFFWAPSAIPIGWVLSICASIAEVYSKRRPKRLVLYLVIPLLLAGIDLLSWQAYLASLP